MSNGEIIDPVGMLTSITENSIENVEESVSEDYQVKKILFIGGPNSGKTSIIRRYFGGCKDILDENLAPTMGVEINLFENKEKIQYAVFEVPGTQIIRYLYGDEAGQVFEEADGIVLILDAEERNIKTIEKKLIRLYYLKNLYCPNASIIVFFHKAEKIIQKTKRIRDLEKLIIRFKKRFSARFFITSLDPEYFKRFKYSMQLALLEMPKSSEEQLKTSSSSDELFNSIASKKVKDLDVVHEMKRKSIRIYENFV
ncbi:MAG: GTPase domain-containing protein [archaeon]|nr:GTPase domain-containing protein [archaeon]